MKKSTKTIVICLAAAIIVTAAAIGTVIAVHKAQNRPVVDTFVETESASSAWIDEEETVETVPEELPTTDNNPEETTGEAETRLTTTQTTAKVAATTKAPAATKPVTTAKPTTTKPTTAARAAATTGAAKGTYKLTVSGDSGTAEIKGGGMYRAGDKVTVSAATYYGYKFLQWTSSDPSLLPNGTAKSYTFTMPAGNVTLKVKTEAETTALTTKKPTALVQVQAGEGVQSVSGGGTFAEGVSVSVSAVLKTGYEFSGWMENGSAVSTQKSYSFKMPNHSVTLTAVGKPQMFTVTVSAGNGIASVSGSGKYKVGDTVKISATAQPNYTFASWSGEAIGNSSSASTTFTMPAKNVSLTASANEHTKYTLTVTKGNTGITTVSEGGSYYAGESVTVTCQLSEGFIFKEWTSSNSEVLKNGTTQSYSFKMPSADVTLTAKAEQNQFTVTVNKSTGVKSVSGGGKYTVGSTVTVNCQIDTGYLFSQWSSSSTSLVKNGTTQSYSFTMPKGNVTLTAKAVNNQFTVSVYTSTGVKSVSGGGKYTVGNSVTVNCQLETGYKFSQWSSSSTSLVKNGSTQSYSFTMPKGDIKLTAKAERDQYTVTVNTSTGVKSVSGGGKYTVGSTVTVNCQIETGYKFSQWASSSTSLVKNGSTQSYSFTMPKGNVTLTAKAIDNKFTLKVSGGDEFSSVSGGGKYVAGSSVTVSCTPKSDYKFTEWTSSNTGKLKGSTAQSYTFTMPEADVTLTAKGEKIQFKLTVQKGTGISSVSGGGTYTVGTAVTVGCTPSTGYVFTKWTSNKTSLLSGSTAQSFSFNMPKGDVTLTAQAEKIPQYTVSITKGSGIRSVTGAGSSFKAGDTVTVYADVSSGYVFDCWTLNGSTVCTTQTYTFTMPDKNVSLTAKAVRDTGY